MEEKAKTINSVHSGFGCFFLRIGNKLISVEGSVWYTVSAQYILGSTEQIHMPF